MNAFEPPMRRFRFWAKMLGLWSIPVAISAIVVYIRMLQGAGEASWIRAISGSMPFWYLWAMLTPLVWWLDSRFSIEEGNTWASVSIHAVLAGVVSIAHGAMTLLILRSTIYADETNSLLDGLRGFASAYFPFQYLIYWAILGVRYLLDYQDRYRSGSVRAAQLEAQLAQAHLQALRVQIQPHFLFNTLHSISSLMDDDLETARRMLVRLGDLLRLTLDTQGVHEIPLQKELECVELYLDIERVRFPEQLHVDMIVEPDALNAMVPNLILQPLVENAIRYGIAPKQEGGTITIEARRRNARLRLRVVDDGPGRSAPPSSGSGVGLANVRSRLLELYGGHQELTLFEPEPKGFGVEITFPFKPAPVEVAQ